MELGTVLSIYIHVKSSGVTLIKDTVSLAGLYTKGKQLLSAILSPKFCLLRNSGLLQNLCRSKISRITISINILDISTRLYSIVCPSYAMKAKVVKSFGLSSDEIMLSSSKSWSVCTFADSFFQMTKNILSEALITCPESQISNYDNGADSLIARWGVSQLIDDCRSSARLGLVLFMYGGFIWAIQTYSVLPDPYVVCICKLQLLICYRLQGKKEGI